MARLPDPVVEEIEVAWPKGYRNKAKELYLMIGLAIRKAERAKKEKGGKGKDETD